MKKKKKKNTHAFLLLSKSYNRSLMSLFKKLKGVANMMNGEAFLLLHCDDENKIKQKRTQPSHNFTNSILVDLGYTPLESALLPGSNHFPLLDFYLKYKKFDFYWLIEDDVRFTGNWFDFFSSFSGENMGHDFITSHIRTLEEEPYWYWWASLRHQSNPIPARSFIRSFNPIYRISSRALNFIDVKLKSNWTGHHEVLLPTLLHYYGFDILDFGGTGKFVLNGFENKYYIDMNDIGGNLSEGASMRFRPVMERPGRRKDKLYHPVKFFSSNADLREASLEPN